MTSSLGAPDFTEKGPTLSNPAAAFLRSYNAIE
jgi:hypothetical protein